MRRLIDTDRAVKNLFLGIGWLCFVLFVTGCVVAKTVPSEVDTRCRLTTRKVALDFSEQGAGASVKAVLQTTKGCNNAECLLIVPAGLVAIPVGSVIVSGSIMIAGNTIHWLEAQGRCDDSATRKALNGLVEVTKSAGGKVVESYRDLSDWIEKNILQQEKVEAKARE